MDDNADMGVYDPVFGYSPSDSFDFNGYSYSDPIHPTRTWGENGIDLGWTGNDTGTLSSLFTNAGFSGPASSDPYAGTDNAGTASITPQLINWLQSTGNHVGLAGGIGGHDYSLVGLFNKDNKLIGDQQGWSNDAGPLWDMAVNMAAGAATGGIGSGLGFSGGLATGISGAAGGALGSAMQGGNILQGAVGGGLGAGLAGSDLAGSMGIDNKYLKNLTNKSIGGAGAALSRGANPLQGAYNSAVGSIAPMGLNYAGGALNNYANSPDAGGKMDFYDGTTGDSAFENPINTGGAYNGSLNSVLGMSQAPGYSSSTIPGFTAENAAPQTNGQSYATPDFMSGNTGMSSTPQSNPIKEALKGLMSVSSNFAPSGNPGQGFGNLVGGLAGLYSGYMQRKRNGQIAGGLASMYGPNSAYSQQLRQQLDRRDAAAGRRSQYGPREVELQARLADMNSRNAPTLANLYGAQNQGTERMLSNVIRLGQQSGAFGKLQDWMNGYSNDYALGPNAGPQLEGN